MTKGQSCAAGNHASESVGCCPVLEPVMVWCWHPELEDAVAETIVIQMQ